MKCIVCDKPVAGSSNVCSTSCLLAAGPAGGGKGGRAKGRAAVGLINDMFAASLEGRSDPWKDVPMIVVKHRWMKNRNQSFGNTNLSFNDEGIARVADVGNARLDVEGYVRHSRGLAVIVDPASVTVPEVSPPPVPVPKPKPAPKPKPPVVEVVKEPEPDFESSAAEEPVMEISEEMEPEEVVNVLLKDKEEDEEKPKASKKKPPRKKSSTKKKK